MQPGITCKEELNRKKRVGGAWAARLYYYGLEETFVPGCLIYPTEPTVCNVATGKLRRDGTCTGPVSSIPCMSVTSGS